MRVANTDLSVGLKNMNERIIDKYGFYTYTYNDLIRANKALNLLLGYNISCRSKHKNRPDRRCDSCNTRFKCWTVRL